MAHQQQEPVNAEPAEPSDWLSALLAFFPSFVSTGYSIIGVGFLGWKASDVFFWFWWEMMNVLMAGVAIALLWSRGRNNRVPQPFSAVFSCLIIILIGTMFGVLSFGEQHPPNAWAKIGNLVLERKIPLGLLSLTFLASTLRTTGGGRLITLEWRQIESPVLCYAWPILTLYGAMILHYHLTGSRSLDLTQPYVRSMALVLLAAKFLFELRRWFRRFRVSQKSAADAGSAGCR